MATLYRVLMTYDGRCFGCGPENQDGIQMRFEPTADGSVCELTLPERYQSWQGMIHGGVVALMLDEAVGWAGWHAGRPGPRGPAPVPLPAVGGALPGTPSDPSGGGAAGW